MGRPVRKEGTMVSVLGPKRGSVEWYDDVEARLRTVEQWLLGNLDPVARERYGVTLEEHRRELREDRG